MSWSDRFQVNPKIVNATIDGEVIMLNLDRGRYYSLTASGADAWNAIERGATTGEILQEFRARYEASQLEIEGALLRLFKDLREEDLILPGEAGNGQADGGSADAPGAPGQRLPFEAPLLQAFTDMEELLLLDPIHEVDAAGWPNRKPDGTPMAG